MLHASGISSSFSEAGSSTGSPLLGSFMKWRPCMAGAGQCCGNRQDRQDRSPKPGRLRLPQSGTFFPDASIISRSDHLELFTTIATMPRAQWHGHSRQALQSQATSDSLQTKCLSNSTRRDATFHTTNTTPHGGNDAGPVFSDARGRTRNIETTHRARHLPGRWAGETVGLEMDSSLPSPIPSRTCTYEGTSNGQRQLGRAGCLEIQLRPRHVADCFLWPLVAANEGD